jgi:AraC-like DNA-binding protein
MSNVYRCCQICINRASIDPNSGDGAPLIQFDKPFLDTFNRIEVRPADIDLDGRFTRELAALSGIMSYRLRGRARFADPSEDVTSMQAIRREGSLRSCYNVDHHGTDVSIIGGGQPHLFGFVRTLSGAMEMAEGPNGSATAHGAHGLILRGHAGTRIRSLGGTARVTLWIDVERFERMLAAELGEPARRPLIFTSTVDWDRGPAGAVWRLIAYLFQELRDPDGITGDPIARETFTDLLARTVLRRLPHNHSERLDRTPPTAIPRHLRQAEAFMHAAAAEPITLPDIAAAAGCSLGTLQAAFRRFRDTTPSEALREVRLRQVRDALRNADDDVSTRTIARRFGFTNPSRFIAAYGKRFGERPAETRRRRPV